MALLINGVEVDPSECAPTKEQLARAWKNAELERTNIVMATSDYVHKEAMAAYRLALVNWSDSPDFPDVRPQMPLTSKGFPIY